MDAKTESAGESLQAEMRQLRADLSKIEGTLKAIVAERADATYGHVRDTARKAAAQASHVTESLENEIRARPITNVATAFGVGIVLGMLFGRR